jgi:hypothetical protein
MVLLRLAAKNMNQYLNFPMRSKFHANLIFNLAVVIKPDEQKLYATVNVQFPSASWHIPKHPCQYPPPVSWHIPSHRCKYSPQRQGCFSYTSIFNVKELYSFP